MKHIDVGSCSHDVVYHIGEQRGLDDLVLSVGQCVRCATSVTIENEKYAIASRLELHKNFTDLNKRAYTIHDIYVRMDKPEYKNERTGL